MARIGAEAPWDIGDYFWWGDTVGHSSSSGFSFSTYNTPTCYSSLPKMMSEGWITVENVLSLKHDAAYVRCGILGEWLGNTGLEASAMGERWGRYGCKALKRRLFTVKRRLLKLMRRLFVV